MIPANGWLKRLLFVRPPNDICCRESGHATPAIGWLKPSPNESFYSVAGHLILAMGWFKATTHVPNDICCIEACHKTMAIGWLKRFPKKIRCREADQSTPAIGWSKSSPNHSSCKMPAMQPTDGLVERGFERYLLARLEPLHELDCFVQPWLFPELYGPYVGRPRKPGDALVERAAERYLLDRPCPQ